METRNEIRFGAVKSVKEELSLTASGARRLADRVRSGLARLCDFVAPGTADPRRPAETAIERYLGRTLSAVIETSISNIGVGLLPEVPPSCRTG